MNTATLMAMMRRRHEGALAEHRHDLAEALVRGLVLEELRRFLLRQQRPDGLGIFARGSPDDHVVFAVARTDQESRALGVVVDVGDVGERDARRAAQASKTPLRLPSKTSVSASTISLPSPVSPKVLLRGCPERAGWPVL